MAVIDLVNLSDSFDIGDDLQGRIVRDWSSSHIRWSAVSKAQVKVDGTGLVYDQGSERVTSGTITSVTITLSEDSRIADIVMSKLSVDYGALSAQFDGLSEDEQENLFWTTVMAGDDDVGLGSGAHPLVFGADGYELNEGQAYNGGDDKLTGLIGPKGEIAGDVLSVLAGSTLNGGSDTFTIDGSEGIIVGDASGVYGDVNGGDDAITVAAAGNASVIGDVYWGHGTTTTGGADTIVVDGEDTDQLDVSGDVASVDDASTVTGGADSITVAIGADTKTLNIAGDVAQIEDAATGDVSSVIGGSDRITLTVAGSAWLDVSGDARLLYNSTLTGGNDTIVLKGTYGGGALVGDVTTAHDGAVVIGGNDRITVGAGSHSRSLYGDVVEAEGNVTITGGNDVLRGGVAGDFLYGDTGTDIGGATVVGGNDRLFGNAGADTLHGGGGNDFMNGGKDKDSMFGGAGDDSYVVDNKGDVLHEEAGEGIDLVKSSVGFRLGADLENLTLTGKAKINATGNDLDNVIVGNSGSGRIFGKEGMDTLTGGRGKDIFVFDTGLGADNIDTITDYASADTFHLDNAVFRGLKDGALARSGFAVITDAGSTAGIGASGRILHDRADGDLYFDRDGSGGKYDPVLFAHVEEGTRLDHTEFLIV